MKDLELVSIIEKISKEENCEIRPIFGILERYYASSHGQIYSYINNKWSLLRQSNRGSGYRQVCLYLNGKKKSYKVHRLIASVFIGPSDLPVNHKNGRKSDNSVKNLEYITQGQNSDHARRSGFMVRGENSPASKLSKKEVLEIFSASKEISNVKLSKIYGVSDVAIRNIRQGKTWKHITTKKEQHANHINEKR